LCLFLFGAAIYQFAVPERWKLVLSTDMGVKSSIMTICWLSTLRFAAHWNVPYWIVLAINSSIFLVYSATTDAADQGKMHSLTVAAIASWLLILAGFFIYKVVPPHWRPRIKWGNGSKESWQAKRIQREQALKAMIASSRKEEEEVIPIKDRTHC
jgi:hypothetical protein